MKFIAAGPQNYDQTSTPGTTAWPAVRAFDEWIFDQRVEDESHR